MITTEHVTLLGIPAVWALVLTGAVFLLARRHWITAGLIAAVQVTATWAAVASVTIGPADVHLLWSGHLAALAGDLRADYVQAWGWAGGPPWELFTVVAFLFAFCKLRHMVWVRKTARKAAAELARQITAAMLPAPAPAPPWAPAPPPGSQR
jgi:hypothetical protein